MFQECLIALDVMMFMDKARLATTDDERQVYTELAQQRQQDLPNPPAP